MGLHILQSQDSRLLHHIAQVAGKRQLRTFSLRQRSLDEENLTTNAGPCQSSYHTGIVVTLVDVAIERRFAQEVFQRFGRNLPVVYRAFHLSLVGYLAHGLIDLLLQLAHTAFAGVLFDNLLNSCLVELRFLGERIQSSILQFPGNQMALGYLDFLFGDVATHLDNLHAVEQWARDSAQIIGCGDEEHFRQVIVYVEVVIVESGVLLGVEHLEKSRSGIAMHSGLCHFVYLVEDKDGIARSGFLNVLDDTTGHSTDIGATMTTYLSFIVQSTQRHAHVLAVHGFGNRLTQ